VRPQAGGRRNQGRRLLPRAAGRGRSHFRSPFLHQPPPHRLRPFITLRMGSFSHAARGRRFPGPVVHPRVAVPPQRCSWLSTGKRGDHDVANGDPEPQPLLGWHDSFSALQPDQRRDLCRLCLLERPTPTCVFSYQKNRHGPAASACKLKV
jgi:hypothetical protein